MINQQSPHCTFCNPKQYWGKSATECCVVDTIARAQARRHSRNKSRSRISSPVRPGGGVLRVLLQRPPIHGRFVFLVYSRVERCRRCRAGGRHVFHSSRVTEVGRSFEPVRNIAACASAMAGLVRLVPSVEVANY